MRTFTFLLLLPISISLAEASGKIISKKAQFIDEEPNKTELLQQEVQNLLARVEVLEHRLAQLERSTNIPLKPSGDLVPEDSMADAGPGTEPAKTTESTSPAQESLMKELDIFDIPAQDVTPEEKKADTDKQAYDLALAALKDNKLEAAEQKFAGFLVSYPKSILLSKVYFWYGETFFRRNMFDKAAINYLKSYKNSPKGEKASDALLKLALSLGSLKKNTEACNVLSKLDKEFPNRASASIKRANDAKIKFGCKAPNK